MNKVKIPNTSVDLFVSVYSNDSIARLEDYDFTKASKGASPTPWTILAHKKLL